MRSKKAVFFSTDAIIGLTIIFIILLISFPIIYKERPKTQIHRDLLNSLSSLNIGEINNSYVQSLISSGQIKNLNNSLLEQIGEYYVIDINMARLLTESILQDIDTNENIGIWYENKFVSAINKTPYETAENVETARQIISGISDVNQSVTGYSARAYLTNSLQKKYFFFGGYVGDGNITAQIEFNGEIKEAELELSINNDFEILINSIPSGTYSASVDDFTPVTYYMPIANFNSGTNIIEFKGINLHIAGGFIKLTYETTAPQSQTKKYNFPGINGLINIYDGFYIPGNLSSLDISLHLQTDFEAFLNIGNTTVFRNTSSVEQTISISNSTLFSLLNYNALNKNTIPLRLGLENVSFIKSIYQNFNVISVTDLSGSMRCSAFVPPWWWTCFSSEFFCESLCGGNWMEPIINAKIANNLFINSILNITGNKVGLVGYSTNAEDQNVHQLSTDNDSLILKVDSWAVGGNTCICCGINRGITEIISNGDEKNLSAMVVMSDGEATKQCPEQNTGNPKQDAIQAACDAKNIYNITVHTVGFGDSVDSTTLQQMIDPDCGNGTYSYGNAEDIANIYSQIAQSIIEASYKEQTIESKGNKTTILFPDSYIQFKYDENKIPYGLIITSENQFYSQFEGNFSIPSDATIVETKAISYSGPKWTDTVSINSNPIYKLTNYGQNYIPLGDPYSINIPNSAIQQDNIVSLTVGLLPLNSSAGSISNKIIYTIVKNASSYSNIAPNIQGCNWVIEFEDNSNLTIPIPSNYTDSNFCFYTSSQQIYDNNDATQNAVKDLLKLLDINSNNKIETKFSEQDLQIELSLITGIPYTWSTEVQIRRWY
jgi:hypothetical protein